MGASAKKGVESWKVTPLEYGAKNIIYDPLYFNREDPDFLPPDPAELE